MKNSKPILTLLWSAAILSLLAGLGLSLSSSRQIGPTKERWQKQAGQMQEMMALRAKAATHRELLNRYAQYPGTPPQLESVARHAVPGLNPATRSTEVQPSVAGWTARKVSVALSDISGDDLGRFLEEASRTTPPWALLDCTLSASATTGRLAKVEMTLVTVEK